MNIYIFVNSGDYYGYEKKLEIIDSLVSGRPLIYYVLDSFVELKPEKITFLSSENINFLHSCFPGYEYSGMKIDFICNEIITFDIFSSDEDIILSDLNSVFDFSLKKIKDFSTVVSFCRYSGEALSAENINIDFDGTVLKKSDFSQSENKESAYFTGLLFIPAGKVTFEEEKECRSVNSVFDYLLLNKVLIKAEITDGYFRKITDYRSLLDFQSDVLNGKYKTYHCDEGLYLEDKVSGGDYLLIPPVYIGKNVQIEKGSVIGPCVAVNSGTLISSDTKIKNSLLLNNVYVSSFCDINGAVLCEGVSVKMGSIIEKGAVICRNAVIPEKTRVHEEEYFRKSNLVSFLVKSEEDENNAAHYRLSEMLSPVNISEFGCALAAYYENSKIGIASDGEVNSEALKSGLLCGLISCGAKVYDFGKSFFSQMFYFSDFFHLKACIFISGGKNGMSLDICKSDKTEFSAYDYRIINEIIKSKSIRYASPEKCKAVQVIDGVMSLYCSEAVKLFDGIRCDLNISVFSEDKQINYCVTDCFKRLGIESDNTDLIFKINKKGTRLTAIYNNKSFSHNSLLCIARYYNFKNGNNISFSYGEYNDVIIVKNGFEEENDDKINTLYGKDAFFLMFEIIYILQKNRKSLTELSVDIPEYYRVKKVIELKNKPQIVAKNLINKGFCRDENGGLFYKEGKNSARIYMNSDGKSLKFIADAVSAEIAEEIFFSVEKIIKSIDNNCN